MLRRLKLNSKREIRAYCLPAYLAPDDEVSFTHLISLKPREAGPITHSQIKTAPRDSVMSLRLWGEATLKPVSCLRGDVANGLG